MINKLIVSLCLIGLTTAVTYDSSLYCDCSELDQTDCASALGYCLWNSSDSECQDFDLDCGDITASGSCDVFDSCQWINGSCEDVEDLECSDGSTSNICRKIDECYWNKESKCSSFSKCDDYNVEDCPYGQGCTITSGSCAAVQYVTCSSFTTALTCDGQDSKTSRCAWGNDNTCKSLNTDYSCSDLNNFQNICNNSGTCIYESNTCRERKCSDITNSFACDRIRSADYKFTLCSWTNGACAVADASTLTQNECYQKTSGNYKWADNKCVQCDELNDKFSESNSYILGAVALLFILLE
ncbi:unnamed protein product [Paramecium pentaurelia]|uniref:Uncharacterized protein n=1 Tax=Paramecium pentaurelia TaxID=43138 RepID=A0A8S1UUS8_9CILI|nr:unnamed protein product [Paramecium pentaurelia]